MKALVTGGAGFIGSNIVRLLIDKGIEVKILDNLSTGYRKNIENLDIDFINGDVRDTDLVEKISRDVTIVFHLAANIGNVKSLNNPIEDSQINVIGTLNVLESAKKSNVERIVYSSSAGIFGELVTMPIAEDHPQNPDSPYGVSKLAGEKQMLCYDKLYDLSVVCLRYFNVYGINQRFDEYGNVIPIFSERLVRGEPIIIYGDGEQTRDFVNVKDVAMANYLAATAENVSNIYNVGSGMNISINHLESTIQNASGIAATSVDHVDPRPGEVRHCCANITKAREELDFDPDPDIESGLREYFDWFKEDCKKR